MSEQADSARFRGLLREANLDFTPEQMEALVEYRNLVVEGNKRQNLSRILDPSDFLERNCRDVAALRDSGFWADLNVDHGSGAGVPGVIAGILGLGRWVLTESEGKKAEFLAETVEKLGIGGSVEVLRGRTEEFLRSSKGAWNVVSRGVGSAAKIVDLISRCSTWNSMVLFKGKSWEREAGELETARMRKNVRVRNIYEYQVCIDSEAAVFRLIQLERVPRGTTNRKNVLHDSETKDTLSK